MFKLALQQWLCAVPSVGLICFLSTDHQLLISLLSSPPRHRSTEFIHTTEHNLKYQRAKLINSTHSAIVESLCLCKFPFRITLTHKFRISSYMLLFFRGELTEPFLCWLREPPMATAESVFVSGLSQMLCMSFFPSQGSPLLLLQTAWLNARVP